MINTASATSIVDLYLQIGNIPKIAFSISDDPVTNHHFSERDKGRRLKRQTMNPLQSPLYYIPMPLTTLLQRHQHW
jgi:hypothetical protein